MTHFPDERWTVIITRSETEDGPLARGLSRRGARVVSVPTLEHRPPADPNPLERVAAALATYDWITFSSARGVEAMARVDPAGLSRCRARIACIGDATAEAVVHLAGREPDLVARNAGADGLLEMFGQRDDVAGSRMLLPQSSIARAVLEKGLRALGAGLDIVTAYETVPMENGHALLEHALQALPCAILFSSPSAGRCLAALSPAECVILRERVILGSMGPTTSAALREAGVEPHFEPEERSFDGFAEATARAAGGAP